MGKLITVQLNIAFEMSSPDSDISLLYELALFSFPFSFRSPSIFGFQMFLFPGLGATQRLGGPITTQLGSRP